ncbi:hypothetical protein TNCV_1133731 [Trichonephila clavipes]|nr:hypothetical protein TNCV_1133731 [Trichonephila clavipes]
MSSSLVPLKIHRVEELMQVKSVEDQNPPISKGLHRNVGASRFNEPDGRQGCVLARTVESNQGGRFDSNESVADSFPSGAVGFKSSCTTILGAFSLLRLPEKTSRREANSLPEVRKTEKKSNNSTRGTPLKQTKTARRHRRTVGRCRSQQKSDQRLGKKKEAILAGVPRNSCSKHILLEVWGISKKRVSKGKGSADRLKIGPLC